MRYVIFCMLAVLAFARGDQELRERVRDGIKRTDKDLGTLVHREKLGKDQRDRFDGLVKELDQLREAISKEKWEGERERFEHTVEKLDDFVKHAPIEDGDRQTLGIDVYTMQVILDSWKAAPAPQR